MCAEQNNTKHGTSSGRTTSFVSIMMLLLLVSVFILICLSGFSNSRELQGVMASDTAYSQCQRDAAQGLAITPECAGLAEKYSGANRRCFADMHFKRSIDQKCLAYVQKFGGRSIVKNGSN